MRRSFLKIKKSIGRRLPRKWMPYLRRAYKILTFTKNPKIPDEELRLFELLKNDIYVVFDVGAREDLAFYKIRPDCSYHLFEPNTKFIRKLEQQLSKLPNDKIRLNKYGLGDTNQDGCVYYEDSQSFTVNTFHEDIDTGKRFSIRRLDDYVIQNNISHIDFLKIDAEGYDYKIMLGGQNTISSKVSYIQFEYWDNVSNFLKILDQFSLFILNEPRFVEAIIEHKNLMTTDQREIDFTKSLIPLNTSAVALIDNILAPRGCGGNIFGINKNLDVSNIYEKLLFNIDVPAS